MTTRHNPDLLLLRLRAQIRFDLFPDFETLRFCIYNSSGWSKGKAAHMVSLHFVWPDVIVSHERARIVRQVTLAIAHVVPLAPEETRRNQDLARKAVQAGEKRQVLKGQADDCAGHQDSRTPG